MNTIQHYQNVAASLPDSELSSSTGLPEALCMRRDGETAVYYAPFDHVNTRARLVIVGITPGVQQAVNAVRSYRDAIMQGFERDEALHSAKVNGSFSGPLRSNLVALLDYLGVHDWLGIESCTSLFGANSALVHFTSALRYPVLVKEKNYQGRSPLMTKNPLLRDELERWLPRELNDLSMPLLVPLGESVELALEHLVAQGLVEGSTVIRGLPHPSGANAERLSYFMERKTAAECSAKVDTAKMDAGRKRAREAMASVSGTGRAAVAYDGGHIQRPSQNSDGGSPARTNVASETGGEPVITYRVSRGQARGTLCVPHRHGNGRYVVSNSRYRGDYVYVDTLAEVLRYLERGFRVRVSDPSGRTAPSLVRRESLEIRVPQQTETGDAPD